MSHVEKISLLIEKHPWLVLGYDYAAYRGCRQYYEHVSDRYEYGLDWCQFVENEGYYKDTYPLLDAWWSELDDYAKRGMFEAVIKGLHDDRDVLSLRIEKITQYLK